jgi:hypothetical protein
MLGLIFIAIAVASAIRLDGTWQTVAIVVAVLNGLSYIWQNVELTSGEPAGGSTLLSFLTSMAAVGLLIYSLV